MFDETSKYEAWGVDTSDLGDDYRSFVDQCRREAEQYHRAQVEYFNAEGLEIEAVTDDGVPVTDLRRDPKGIWGWAGKIAQRYTDGSWEVLDNTYIQPVRFSPKWEKIFAEKASEEAKAKAEAEAKAAKEAEAELAWEAYRATLIGAFKAVDGAVVETTPAGSLLVNARDVRTDRDGDVWVVADAIVMRGVAIREYLATGEWPDPVEKRYVDGDAWRARVAV